MTADGSNRIKPDISAPGTNTRSCTNASDTSYAISAAPPWPLRTSRAQWRCCGRRFPACDTSLRASRDALNNSAVHIDSTQCGDCGPSKQRVWLGSRRYSCCRGRKYTDANSDGYRHANSQSHCNQGYATTDANTKEGAIPKAAPHASAQARKSFRTGNSNYGLPATARDINARCSRRYSVSIRGRPCPLFEVCAPRKSECVIKSLK